MNNQEGKLRAAHAVLHAHQKRNKVSSLPAFVLSGVATIYGFLNLVTSWRNQTSEEELGTVFHQSVAIGQELVGVAALVLAVVLGILGYAVKIYNQLRQQQLDYLKISPN